MRPCYIMSWQTHHRRCVDSGETQAQHPRSNGKVLSVFAFWFVYEPRQEIVLLRWGSGSQGMIGTENKTHEIVSLFHIAPSRNKRSKKFYPITLALVKFTTCQVIHEATTDISIDEIWIRRCRMETHGRRHEGVKLRSRAVLTTSKVYSMQILTQRGFLPNHGQNQLAIPVR
jgi:hypothetical protein